MAALVLLLAARAASAQEQAAPADQVQVTPPGAAEPAGPPPPPPTGTVPPQEATKPEAAPVTAGWVPGEGFLIRGADPNYKLRIGMQDAYKLEPVYQAGEAVDRRAFFVLRPILAGNFFREWIRFWTSLELNSNPPFVLDTYVEVQPVTEFGLRIGQQYTLLSRHEQFGPQQILFPEWAPVAEYFWTGRDKGFTAWGTVLSSFLEYYAGVYGGSPLRQFTTIPGNYVLEGRLAFNPLGATGTTEFPYIADKPAPFRFSISIQGVYGKLQLAEENFNPTTFRFVANATGMTKKKALGGADFFVQGPFFAALVEGYVQRTDPDLAMSGDSYTSVGVWGQIGVLLIPRTLDFGVRVNWLDPSVDLSNDQFISGEVQFAWYISHSQNLALRVRYGYGRQHSPGKEALGSVALFTTEGEIHIGTLQLTLAF